MNFLCLFSHSFVSSPFFSFFLSVCCSELVRLVLAEARWPRENTGRILLRVAGALNGLPGPLEGPLLNRPGRRGKRPPLLQRQVNLATLPTGGVSVDRPTGCSSALLGPGRMPLDQQGRAHVRRGTRARLLSTTTREGRVQGCQCRMPHRPPGSRGGIHSVCLRVHVLLEPLPGHRGMMSQCGGEVLLSDRQPEGHQVVRMETQSEEGVENRIGCPEKRFFDSKPAGVVEDLRVGLDVLEHEEVLCLLFVEDAVVEQSSLPPELHRTRVAKSICTLPVLQRILHIPEGFALQVDLCRGNQRNVHPDTGVLACSGHHLHHCCHRNSSKLPALGCTAETSDGRAVSSQSRLHENGRQVAVCQSQVAIECRGKGGPPLVSEEMSHCCEFAAVPSVFFFSSRVPS
mmetsp:Transcript_13318/g.26301  ORF Transcript_13318/g.26301 Transcript_13318/m.26301 type:complete len:401 (+) Transcript_13318:864-2066(+)